MKTVDFFNLFLLVSSLHGFLFSVILFFSKDGKKKSMLYLNLLVLVISLNNFQSWVLAKHFFTTYFFLDYVHIPWHFFIAPFFYMFLIHYLKIAERSKNILKIIVPFFILIVCIRFVFIYINRNNSTPNTRFLFEKYTSYEEIISLLVSLSVFGYSFYILYKKEKLFKDVLSYDNLQWIYTFFKLGALTYMFWIVALAITISLNFSQFIYSYYPLRILTTVLIYWIGYQGFLRLKIITERKKLRNSLGINRNIKRVSSKKLFDENEFIEIDTYIKQHFIYTNTQLTQSNLANDLDISSSKLSSLIKHFEKKSFTDYINNLRVLQAKKLLKDPDYSNYTVVAIGLESGFNSKSRFFTVFKKHVGCSPFSYKNKHIEKN